MYGCNALAFKKLKRSRYLVCSVICLEQATHNNESYGDGRVSQSVYFKEDLPQLILFQRLAVCLSLLVSTTHGFAWSYKFDQDWQVEANHSLSLASSWSMEKPSSALLYDPDANKVGREGHSIDVNGDNGRVNFDQYDAISQIVKGYSEFKLNGPQQGAVLSSKYWYDHAYESGHGDLLSFDDTAWPRLAKFKGIDLWDAYIWKNFKFNNDQSLNLTLGKHRLNWGKSQFFHNGLNSVSAFDYAAMNRPGGDPRERVIPVEMFSFAADIAKNLKFEGFYQFKFRPSVVDGCGTFFEISDLVPENCGPLIITAGLDDKSTEGALRAKSYIPRTASQKARDSGQYGFALKQILPSLNNAELGIYFANYHSRLTHFDGTNVTASGAKNFHTATIFSIYPEDIKMYGLSLAGKVGTTTFFSELSYKPDMPLHFNSPDLVYYQVLSNDTPFTPAGERGELGGYAQGYASLPVTQFSIGASDQINHILGANHFNWAAEFAVDHIADIGNHRLGRSGAFGRSELSTGAYDPVSKANQCTTYGTGNLSNEEVDRMNELYCNRDGYYSTWSMGYRLRGALTYKDVIPATTITPSLNFRHDISGYGFNFQEGQMSIGATLSATYQNKYTAELAYTNFFGSNKFSVIDDRDFASLAFKVNF